MGFGFCDPERPGARIELKKNYRVHEDESISLQRRHGDLSGTCIIVNNYSGT